MLNRLTLRQKFLLLPVLLCLGLALLFVLHGVNSRRQQADLDFVRQQGLSQLETSQNLLARQEQIVNLLNSAATTGDADALALAKTLHGQQSQALAALQNADGVAADVREASQASAQYFAQAYQMAEQMAAGKLDMARAAEHAQALKSTLDVTQAALGRLRQHSRDGLAARIDQIEADSRRFGLALGGLLALTVLLGLGGAWYVARQVSSQVLHLRDNLHTLAQGDGDLTVRLPTGGRDEIKIVIASRGDYEWARDVVRQRQIDAICPVLFSPAQGLLEARSLADWILEDGLNVRFQLQLHKLLWGNMQGK